MRNFAKILTLTAAMLAVGCGSDDESFNFANFVTGNPAQAPIAVADTFSVLGNGVLTGFVTANDTINSATVTSFQNTGNSGGTVVINSIGQLTYTPPAGQTNIVDTFTYTLSNSVGNSTATVTVNVGARGFFVKNDVAVTGTGTQSNPFKTLAEAVAAANGVVGAQIVLFRGDGSNTGLNTGFTLGTNQGISSLDPANTANITGPINVTTGNTIKDLRIIGTVGSAVNGTNSSGGSLTNVLIDGATVRGVSLTNSTGTFTVSNSTIRNTVSHGIVASADTGSLVWSVNSSTFANVTGQDVFSNTSTSASQNVTVAGSSSTGGTLQFLFVDANTSGPVGVNLSNNTVVGSGSKARGLSINTHSATALSAIVSNNNVTGCIADGMTIFAEDSSRVKARFSGNRTLGNQINRGLSVVTSSGGGISFGGVFVNNVSDQFVLIQNGTSIFAVENLSQFNTASNNTGTLNQTGTIQDAASGSLGIP